MWVLRDGWTLVVLVPLWMAWVVAAWALPRWRQRTGRTRSLRFSSLAVVRPATGSIWTRLRSWLPVARWLSVALLIAAFARPQLELAQTEVSSEGIDIVLVLDTSGSMRALDLDPGRPMRQRRNRLDISKEVVQRFIERRPSDPIGLVVFGGEAFTQCPLTLDHDVLAGLVDQVDVGVAGDMTAIGSALGTAVKRLRSSQAKSKVIVLLTDGRNNAGALSPGKAAEIAETFGMKVYTVGAGTRGRAPFLVSSVFGEQVVEQDVEIDEETLRQIAATTGGRYFRAEDGESLEKVYDEIDALERTEITTDRYFQYEERFATFVIPALGLLLLELLAAATRLRTLP